MSNERWRIALAVNSKAGAALARPRGELVAKITQALRPAGELADTAEHEGDAFFEALRAFASRDDIDVLAVAGGDGTISAAAAITFEAGKRLLPIPCGTFNLFCRALGFPPDPEGALEMFDRLVPDAVDVGIVNGEIFVHHLSIGMHPRFVRLRDAVPFRSRWQKILATLRATLRSLRSIPRTPAIVVSGSRRWRRRLAGIAITVNPIAEMPISPPVTADPKQGTLAIYMTGIRRRRDALWFLLRAVAGRWKSSGLVETGTGESVRIVTRRATMGVSLDGERRRLRTPLDVRIERAGLKVLRPAPVGQTVEDFASAVSSASAGSIG
jgi:diacylglycerol kinase family enzyme